MFFIDILQELRERLELIVHYTHILLCCHAVFHNIFCWIII